MGAEGMSPELLDDETPWTIADVAEALGVAQSTVHVWRGRGRGRGGVRQMLPVPDAAPIAGRFPYRPRWRAGTVRRWAVQTGRMTVDGVAVPLSPGPKVGPVPDRPPWKPEVVEPDAYRWAMPQIAEFLAVPLEVVLGMRAAGELPEPELIAAYRPLWDAQAVREWAAGR